MSFTDVRRRVLSPIVFIAIIVFSMIGAAVSYGLSVSYKSRSVTWFQSSIFDFRTLKEQVSNANVFNRYLRDDRATSWGPELRSHVVRSDNWISPIFRYSKKDGKELVGLKDSATLSDLIGYEITYFAADAETAQKKVDLLTNYVSDASLKIQIDNFIADSLAAKRLLLTSALLERDTEEYNLTLLEDRFNDLKRLSTSYPIASANSARQIISIEKNGERYMPLPLQMIALERERFDIKEKLTKTQRIVDGLPSEEAMLADHQKLAEKTNVGKDLALVLVKDIQSRILTAKKGYELITLLGYEDKYSRMVTAAFSLSRLMVPPTLPISPVRSPLKSTLLFSLAGAFLALLWQFRDLLKALITKYTSEDSEIAPLADSSSELKRLQHV